MVVKVYVSGISGNKEVKKHQQRVLMILDSKSIAYETIDITEPGKEEEKEFMQQNSKARDSKYPLPPQLFNNEEYCGDYEEFDLANENDELDKFLKVTPSVSKAEITLEKSEISASERKSLIENGEVNGTSSSRENSSEKETSAKSEPREETEDGEEDGEE
ncbi:SH3 domain-binding glutamic acid-rich protein homolog [Anabrus simplex]|uniref:SH3 domain-binding glutamic acid-rich protein homolog n=1 Tax=Anabrus simplex TaxID=316456 RepID=UPI0034DD341E